MGLATMSGEVNERIISLLSPFDRTQGLVCGGKVGLVTFKYQLDPVAWVLPGKINAMKNSLRSSRGLSTTSGEVNVRFIYLLNPFDRTQGLVCGGKVGLVTLKYQLDPVAWVLPGKINAMKNSFRSSRGLATTSGEVNVRYLSLLSPFDRTQGLVCGGKVGLSSHMKISARSSGVGSSRRDKRDEELFT
jgi:hypothetical protein